LASCVLLVRQQRQPIGLCSRYGRRSGKWPGDPACGGGWSRLDHATGAGANAIGLAAIAGKIAADCLLVDTETPEFTPSWDLTWELVRFGNRDRIVG
jgi:cytosine/adenosine deaminase-related metal-dependent hydrolase